MIPCRPSKFDLHATKLTASLARTSKTPAFAIFNQGPPRKAAIYDQCAEVILGFGLDLAPVRLSDRAAYRQSIMTGQTVQETEPAGKAAEEVAALWTWIKSALNLS